MQIPRRFSDWQLPFVIALFCLVAATWGDTAREIFRYDRPAIAAGEYWRLLTGHFLHLGWTHLALNLAGLALVWLLVGRRYGTRQWLLATVLCIGVIDAGFWFLAVGMLWYVGLSGLLHGMLVAGAIRGIAAVPIESVVILVAVAAKVAYEQFAGPLPGSEVAAAGNVVVEAHLYGSVGGVLSAVVLYIMPTRSTPPHEEHA